MGGLWEAGIKSVKYHLKRALGRPRLTYEEFETVIIQVEGILNSRPLTPISNDFENFEPLAENNKGNSGSLEIMEHRLSEYSPTERKVDDREGQCNVWYNGNCKGGFYTVCNWLLGRVVEVYHGSDGKKDELKIVADELNLTVLEGAKIADLKKKKKNLIVNSDVYKNDKELVQSAIDYALAEIKNKRLDSETKLEFERIKLAQLQK
ncbi:integrase catalytic domain-containing protein [Trichonephila clavipes]|nr:integrase catalytic domain-containing protein [Trichonephila clavipes]